jgi:hypothetical protein
MHHQAVDFPALASRPFMAPVAQSVRKLPAATAKRLQNYASRVQAEPPRAHDLGYRFARSVASAPLQTTT